MVKREGDSISKKGYGNGFVSKDRRLPRDANEYFRGPGPGAYEGAGPSPVSASVYINVLLLNPVYTGSLISSTEVPETSRSFPT